MSGDATATRGRPSASAVSETYPGFGDAAGGDQAHDAAGLDEQRVSPGVGIQLMRRPHQVFSPLPFLSKRLRFLVALRNGNAHKARPASAEVLDEHQIAAGLLYLCV